jgi:hypothetical protein
MVYSFGDHFLSLDYYHRRYLWWVEESKGLRSRAIAPLLLSPLSPQSDLFEIKKWIEKFKES